MLTALEPAELSCFSLPAARLCSGIQLNLLFFNLCGYSLLVKQNKIA